MFTRRLHDAFCLFIYLLIALACIVLFLLWCGNFQYARRDLTTLSAFQSPIHPHPTPGAVVVNNGHTHFSQDGLPTGGSR